MAYTPKPTRPVKMTPLNKAKRPNGRNYDRGVWTNNNGTEIARSQLEDAVPIAGKSTGDRAPQRDGYVGRDVTTRRYNERSGAWTNMNGAEVARGASPTSRETLGKSTGDRAPLYDAFIAQRRKAKTKGY
jgi:hypothetical protein